MMHTPYDQDTTTTSISQLIYVESAKVQLSFLSSLMLTAIFVISTGFLGWSIMILNWRLVTYALFIILFGLLSSSGVLAIWKSSKASENEAQCPKCNALWAAEKLDEKLTGVYSKTIFKSGPLRTYIRIFGFIYYPSKFGVDITNSYQRYKIHYKCKYCGFEWLFLVSRK